MKQKNIVVIIILIAAIGVSWKYLDYYVFTIKEHVPIIGMVDTGITKHQFYQFKQAEEKYRKKEETITAQFKNNQISSQEYTDSLAKLNFERVNDPRITAVIGGPAKGILKFLLNKI